MIDLSRVGVTGPLEPFVAGFASELARQGYARSSVLRHLDLLAHLSRWLAAEGLDASHLTPDVLERFMVARRAGGYTDRRCTTRSLVPLAGYLRSLGAAPPPPPAASPCTPVEELLERYRRYLVSERGLTAEWASTLVGTARVFLAKQANHGEFDLRGLSSADVSGYVLAECHSCSRYQAKRLVSGLRSLLRFLQLEGEVESSLLGAVPSVASWRLSGLPKALEPGQLEQLLGSCDRRTVIGRRDFAILALLSRLGLRRCEVVRLELDDIDWRAGEIVVRGKGNRRDRLPLPADVGEAVAAHLRSGRPPSAIGRSVFLRAKAPHGALTPRAVERIVSKAGHKAGLGEIGPHRLRHTVATEMLRAGAPLLEIGQVLRHRSSDTTAIYAKVDREALRSLARPWPGGAA
jgi:integrase/recombinase XerD